MILAVDIGNTHIEIGLYEKARYAGSWRIATGVHRTEDELITFIQHFLQFGDHQLAEVQDLAISSVVPNLTQIFYKLSEKYFQQAPFVVTHEVDLGISIDYEPPRNVGADRLCNAVAAFEKYGGPSIIVDLGTATTIDVVSADAVYLGGAIAPGLETATWGLHEKASKLPSISFEFPETVIGKTTEASMKAGVMLGTVKMIDGLIELIQEQLGDPATIIATGGLSRIIAPKSRYIRHVEPQLVLDGLVSIYWRNHPADRHAPGDRRD